jgi:chemosensory pili system protein ChpC
VNDAELVPIQSIIVPTAGDSLLVPSTSVAEVAGVTSISPVAGAPAFVLGVANWRGIRLPVLSWEVLTGAGAVVFYPLPGRDRLDFFGLLSTAAPHSRPISREQLVAEVGAGSDSPYVAAACRIGDASVVIPALAAVREAFTV